MTGRRDVQRKRKLKRRRAMRRMRWWMNTTKALHWCGAIIQWKRAKAMGEQG